MRFWSAKRTDKQTEALVQRMVLDWKVNPAEAKEYVEGRGLYLRMKDVRKPDELRQYQRTKRLTAVDAAAESL